MQSIKHDSKEDKINQLNQPQIRDSTNNNNQARQSRFHLNQKLS